MDSMSKAQALAEGCLPDAMLEPMGLPPRKRWTLEQRMQHLDGWEKHRLGATTGSRDRTSFTSFGVFESAFFQELCAAPLPAGGEPS